MDARRHRREVQAPTARTARRRAKLASRTCSRHRRGSARSARGCPAAKAWEGRPRITCGSPSGATGCARAGCSPGRKKILLTKSRRGLALFERRPAGEERFRLMAEAFRQGGCLTIPIGAVPKFAGKRGLVSLYRHGNRQDINLGVSQGRGGCGAGIRNPERRRGRA